MSNSETSLNVTNTESPAPTLEQRVVKIQFHLQTMAQSAIIIGQELIECKKEVSHGDWQNWLQDNFNLTVRTAQNFMAIAERFGDSKTKSISFLGTTKMISLLALPAGEEEKFIAEKAAEGKPVEDMTVKKLREEIKDYKEKNSKLQQALDNARGQTGDFIEKYQTTNLQLVDAQKTIEQQNAKIKELEGKPPVTVEIEKTKTIVPPDYVATVKRADELQGQVERLLEQNEQSQKTIEALQKQIADGNKQGEPSADFQKKLNFTQQKLDTVREQLTATKTELFHAQQTAENAKAEVEDAKKDAENVQEIFAAEKHIEQLFQAADALINSPHYHKALKNFMQKHTDAKDRIGQVYSVCQQLNAAREAIDAMQAKKM